MRLITHHVAISVRDLDRTTQFYGDLGFRTSVLWESKDGSLRLAHLTSEAGIVLEAFEYSTNGDSARPQFGVGNDLPTLGVKHFGFHVDNLEAVHRDLAERGYEVTQIQHGRTGIDYFFVADPDGIWVEFVHETRNLDPDNIKHVIEQ
ncbi:VOC family protein [Micromonospora sp. NPDC049891]|uniref:VOC family protein n=1 Tax=Micromonospora sp. NPDC049891 TaxID=3155655 RepID=UPI00340BB00D